MKANEVLKIIDKVHDYPCPYGIGGTAWQFIRSCIEKQIPKKVIKNKGYWEINCPYCLTDIAEEKGNEYCVICGQALDWSDENA